MAFYVQIVGFSSQTCSTQVAIPVTRAAIMMKRTNHW